MLLLASATSNKRPLLTLEWLEGRGYLSWVSMQGSGYGKRILEACLGLNSDILIHEHGWRTNYHFWLLILEDRIWQCLRGLFPEGETRTVLHSWLLGHIRHSIEQLTRLSEHLEVRGIHLSCLLVQAFTTGRCHPGCRTAILASKQLLGGQSAIERRSKDCWIACVAGSGERPWHLPEQRLFHGFRTVIILADYRGWLALRVIRYLDVFEHFRQVNAIFLRIVAYSDTLSCCGELLTASWHLNFHIHSLITAIKCDSLEVAWIKNDISLDLLAQLQLNQEGSVALLTRIWLLLLNERSVWFEPKITTRCWCLYWVCIILRHFNSVFNFLNVRNWPQLN